MLVEKVSVPVRKADVIAGLQNDILRLQGFRQTDGSAIDLGLGQLISAFPNATFPLGAVHEFISPRIEDAAATSGFIAGMISPLMRNNGTALWIGTSRTLFPPALKNFGIEPDRIIFVDLQKEIHVLWALEEALKCAALTAVVGELRDISFLASRRLQLAVEQSRVTGFILRCNARKMSTTACVSRWKITPLPAAPIDDLPGIGFPQWSVSLLRIRNGRPGSWTVSWVDGKFQVLPGNLQSKAIPDNVGSKKQA